MSDDVIPFPGRREDDDGHVLLTSEETADRLRICKETLYRMRPEVLPYAVINGRGDRRYRASDVEAFVEERMVTESREAS